MCYLPEDGNRIPGISKILKLIAFWYGRSTWWKLIIKLRKAFVIINAFIGVYTVFKITGFGSDNIIAGVSGLGATYLEMLISFTKRLFYTIADFFDYKIIPNTPPTGPSSFNPMDYISSKPRVPGASIEDYNKNFPKI